MAAAAPSRPRPGGGRLFIIVGLLLALLAGGGAYLLGNLGGGGGGGSTTTVIIAKQNISVRHQITSDDLDTAKVSGTFVNIYTKASDVVNLIAEITITKGVVITSDMLAKDIGLVPAGQAPAYLPLPTGYVALTIPTGEQQGVAGHISLGDYITVISSFSLSLFSVANGQQVGPPKVISVTVFTNIRIIGLGPASANVQPAGSGGAGTGAVSGVTSSLTIEMTQCDAEFLTWFLNNTQVKYTLESFHDYAPSLPPPPATCKTAADAHGVSTTLVEARYGFQNL